MTSQIVITYILKTILISGIFLAYYWIALRDKKFHYYNRFYLLIGSIMSLVIPLLNLNWFTVENPALYNSNEIVKFILPISNENTLTQFSWLDYSLVIVGIVATALLGILFLNILKIQFLKRKCAVTQMDGFDFINTNEDNAPFSFLNNLFWKQSISLQEEGGQQIFKHEITHIQQKHTWDRIYCQTLTSIFWLNPFNWLIQKELITIHEFIADEEAVGNSNIEAFAKMLLQTHYGNHFLNPTHQFFYSSIKRRLFMLNQNKKTKFSHLRRLFVLPITICVVLSFSIKTIEVKASAIIKENFEKNRTQIQSETDTLPKAKLAVLKGKKIKATTKTTVDTIVYTSPTSGSKVTVSGVNLKQNVLDELEKKAKTVIVRKTETGTEKYIIVNSESGKDAATPTYYLDGVKITENQMKAISPNDIESVNVLKGENAIKKYADDGKVGVVEIKLKHKN